MMSSDSIYLLSLIIFLPAFGALMIALMPKGQDDNDVLMEDDA